MDRTTSMMESPLSSLSGMNSSQLSSQFKSPFLQVDPSVLSPQIISDDYIYLDGSNKPSRGRFELAFGQIGVSVMTGAGIGGAMGVFKGYSVNIL